MRKSRTLQSSWLQKTVIALAVSQLATAVGPAFAETVSDMERRMTQRNLVQQAVYQLVAEGRDPDSDGSIEVPAMKSASLAPAGGGVIPDTSGAPKTDGYGGLLGYCAWDNGSQSSSTGRIVGGSGANSMSIAVISYGLDNTYQTTCAQIAAGQGAQGDDFAFWMTNNQVVANNSTNVSLFWGTPVASLTVLNAIGPDALHDGEARLVKSTGKLYQWSAAAQAWMILADAGIYADNLNQHLRTIDSVTFAAVTATTFTGDLTGNAKTATQLKTPRRISATGDASWSVTFDGSANATGALALTNSGVTAGTYGSATTLPQFTVDAKGRVTSASSLPLAPSWDSITDVPDSIRTYAVNSDQFLRTTDSPTFAAVTATTFNGALKGNASTATKLQTPRYISASGDGTWSVAFDGSANVSGALTLTNSGVAAGTYGSATVVPKFVVDAKGRVTSVSNVTVTPAWGSITGVPTSLATGGYAANLNQNLRTTDSPTFAAVTATTFNGNASTASQLKTPRAISASGDGTWSVTFDGSANVSGALTLANSGVAAGTYGSATVVPKFVVDAKGRVTSVSNVTVTPAWGSITGVPASLATGGYAANLNQNLRTTDSPTFSGITDTGFLKFQTAAADYGGSTGIIANKNGWSRIDPNGSRFIITVEPGDVAAGRNILDVERTDTWARLWQLDANGNMTSAGTITANQFKGDLTGNASTASKLQTARTISATGDASWSVTFDGSANATGALTLVNSGVTAGTYGSATTSPQFVVDAKGRVTAASNLTIAPAWSNITSIPTAITTYAVNMNQNVRTTDSPTFAGVNTPSITSKNNLALSAGTGSKIMANAKIQLAQQATEEAACADPGAIAVDANNNLFICR